ncbi:synaptic vesicle glycoprotein 2B [Diachasma alloeum]|uniref:synaptic vesicle glycoprotein 2B n=1 Tax=Diachasma alloeum TaxID=454923 RepID=UPI0007384DA5|nr:synaptic vesicle glycoprotein 2B [Diachasma alloeum]
MFERRQSIDVHAEEHNIDNAVEVAGFGKFNLKVVTVSGLIVFNTAFSISSVGLILPSAACDFNLTTADKGRMSAAPILGMVVGSYFWGCLADLKGRKFALLTALFSQGMFEAISSVVPNYWVYLVLKFFSGFSANGQTAVVFTYLGEFQSSRLRERILCWLELTWSLGLIGLPLVGWGIIPLEISYATKYFHFHSWNLFVLICSLPALVIGLWLLTFPETPKYLAESDDDAKLADTLDLMHKENTGKSFDEYLEKLEKHGGTEFCARLKARSIASKKENSQLAKVGKVFAQVYVQTITILKPPFLQRTAISCAIMFCLGSSYYALTIWFPEIFTRFAKFEAKFPGESASVCSITKSNSVNATNAAHECPVNIPTNVYMHTVILGAACIPLSLLLPAFVYSLGYKFYLISSSIVASAITIGLFFVRSSTQNLVLSAIYEAFTSIGMSIVLCIVIEIFPTKFRAMASALAVFFIRIGALSGNLLFGFLIDNYCVPVIIVLAVQLLVCALLGLLIPLKRREKKIPDENEVTSL